MKRSLSILLMLCIVTVASAQLRHNATSKFTSYRGLVMAGYQGWHSTPEDGGSRGWGQYSQGGAFGPVNNKFDMWPETKEYKKLYQTPFLNADGSGALLPSDLDASTTDVRFGWMKEYGVDGVFMQRFIGNVRSKGKNRNHFNKILGDALDASKKYQRALAVMYDLSGMHDSIDVPLLIKDWKNLVDSMKITNRGKDQNYLYHNGKPLVVLWGVGFNDGRRYTLKSVARIIDFLKNDPEYGHCAVMLGVPTYWREFGNDTEKDSLLHKVVQSVDIIHPWTIGRYSNEESYALYNKVQAGDLEWCKKHAVEYAATVFPGFSWSHLNPTSAFDQIPRNKGRFYWKQITGALKNGARMIYVAMFDEIDEGTAIMKIEQNPPLGASRFLKFEEGIPSDYYLYLTGYAARMLRNEVDFREDIPLPKNAKSARE